MRSNLKPVSDDQDGIVAVSYLRVSTSRQLSTDADVSKDGNSIATQRVETLRKASELGVSIAREFVEPGQSAQTIAHRPVFGQLLRYIDEHPEVRYVLIYMRSRVFRNFTDAAITKRQLLEKGVRLVSAKEEFGEGYMADAMEAITDIMNEVQVRMNGADVAVKMAHKVAQGGTVGRARLGYLNVRKEFEGRLMNTIDIDPARAPLVTLAFELYATGRYSTLDIAEILEARGLTTRASPTRPAHTVDRRLIAQLLRDPYYRGIIRYKGEDYAGRHEPLVSRELFDQVQRVFGLQRGQDTRDVIHHHYLRGLVFCGDCRREGRPGRMVYSRNRGRGGTYEYLVCAAHQHRLCGMQNVRLYAVEASLAAIMKTQRLPAGEEAKLAEIFAPNLTHRPNRHWMDAPDSARRALMTAFLEDVAIYSSTDSRPASS